jgi:outer membrane lipoprotein SlyB
MKKKSIAGLLACLLLAACVSAPTGPSVMVLPGSGRSFDDFRADENFCRRYALEQNGGTSARQNARESAVTSAAVGTAVGAVAGAAVGGQQGAAVGAGAGLVVGSVAGADAAQQSSWGSQRQYDNAYIQCMYAKGHRVPVPANMAPGYPPAAGASASSIPPPPPGQPPAPPSR